jgi:hypothetical protein
MYLVLFGFKILFGVFGFKFFVVRWADIHDIQGLQTFQVGFVFRWFYDYHYLHYYFFCCFVVLYFFVSFWLRSHLWTWSSPLQHWLVVVVSLWTPFPRARVVFVLYPPHSFVGLFHLITSVCYIIFAYVNSCPILSWCCSTWLLLYIVHYLRMLIHAPILLWYYLI